MKPSTYTDCTSTDNPFKPGDKFRLGKATGRIHPQPGAVGSPVITVAFDGDADFLGLQRWITASARWFASVAERIEPDAWETLDTLKSGDKFTWLTTWGEAMGATKDDVFIFIEDTGGSNNPALRKIAVVDLRQGKLLKGAYVARGDKITKIG